MMDEINYSPIDTEKNESSIRGDTEREEDGDKNRAPPSASFSRI